MTVLTHGRKGTGADVCMWGQNRTGRIRGDVKEGSIEPAAPNRLGFLAFICAWRGEGSEKGPSGHRDAQRRRRRGIWGDARVRRGARGARFLEGSSFLGSRRPSALDNFEGAASGATLTARAFRSARLTAENTPIVALQGQ